MKILEITGGDGSNLCCADFCLFLLYILCILYIYICGLLLYYWLVFPVVFHALSLGRKTKHILRAPILSWFSLATKAENSSSRHCFINKVQSLPGGELQKRIEPEGEITSSPVLLIWNSCHLC